MKIATRASRAARMTGMLQVGWDAAAGGLSTVGVGKAEGVLDLWLVGDMIYEEKTVRMKGVLNVGGECQKIVPVKRCEVMKMRCATDRTSDI
jgi:hypothetical protein